jgi:glycosyltransferase involved in cell wall biosynthesis
VDDLTELYDDARLFIAPTRYSAGISLKSYEAAAHGLPIVATTQIGQQLDWTHETELLLADDEQAFAVACARLYRARALWQRLRAQALQRVQTECCPVSFTEQLKAIINDG